MGNIIEFQPKDEAAIEIRSSPEYKEAATALMDYVNALDTTNLQLIGFLDLFMVYKHITRRDAFLQGFELGIRIAQSAQADQSTTD